MDRLHQSQIKLYRDAAILSIKEWAVSLPLQPMEEGDTKTAFVERCITAGTAGINALPNWELVTAKATAINEIRKRANATYEKYHPVEEDVVEEEQQANEAGTVGASEDGGADTEDGEMTGDDISDEDDEAGSAGAMDTTGATTISTTTAKVTKQQPAKYAHPNRNKQKGGVIPGS